MALKARIEVDDPYLYFARLTQLWRQTQGPERDPLRHPTAYVHPTAQVDPSARIGPFCVVERGAKIGAHSWLKSHVTVGENCVLGDRCILHAGVSIGADGFGFAPHEGQWVKIEQLGAVRIGLIDGDLVEGSIVKIDRDEVLVDIGYKSEGVIPVKELSIRHDVDPSELVKLGEELEALVLQKEDKEGRLILSKKRAQYERAWGRIEEVMRSGTTIKGPVIEVVKGGLIVDIGLRGFLPASLVELRRVRDLQPYVGKVVQAKIIELDKNRNNVVLSRRAFLEETQKESRDSFLTNLKPGEIRDGVISSVVSFGAFVDLGGMDGLIHVSELSWKHVDHPGAVVAVGDKVTVQVLDVDFDRERISLSLKATQQDPWQEFASNHRVGELVYGRVTKLVPFGAFVQVGDGIEGLVHISELAERHVERSGIDGAPSA